MGTLTLPIILVSQRGGGNTKMYRVGDTETHRRGGGGHKCKSLTDKQTARLIDFTERCSFRGGVYLKLGAS